MFLQWLIAVSEPNHLMIMIRDMANDIPFSGREEATFLNSEGRWVSQVKSVS